jgi:hypothetical protein
LSIKKRSPYKEILRVKWVPLNIRWTDFLMWLNTFPFCFRTNITFENSLIRVLESGVYRRVHSRFYTKKPVCVNSQNFQSISIDDSLPALLIVPFGILTCFVVLFAEKILHAFKANNQFCIKQWALSEIEGWVIGWNHNARKHL